MERSGNHVRPAKNVYVRGGLVKKEDLQVGVSCLMEGREAPVVFIHLWNEIHMIAVELEECLPLERACICSAQIPMEQLLEFHRGHGWKECSLEWLLAEIVAEKAVISVELQPDEESVDVICRLSHIRGGWVSDETVPLEDLEPFFSKKENEDLAEGCSSW